MEQHGNDVAGTGKMIKSVPVLLVLAVAGWYYQYYS
jgi:hypothetical protein